MCGHSTGVITMILSCEYDKRMSEMQDGGLKIQLHKSQLIATKFQRLHLCFRDQATRINYWNTVSCLGMLEIKDGGH